MKYTFINLCGILHGSIGEAHELYYYYSIKVIRQKMKKSIRSGIRITTISIKLNKFIDVKSRSIPSLSRCENWAQGFFSTSNSRIALKNSKEFPHQKRARSLRKSLSRESIKTIACVNGKDFYFYDAEAHKSSIIDGGTWISTFWASAMMTMCLGVSSEFNSSADESSPRRSISFRTASQTMYINMKSARLIWWRILLRCSRKNLYVEFLFLSVRDWSTRRLVWCWGFFSIPGFIHYKPISAELMR